MIFFYFLPFRTIRRFTDKMVFGIEKEWFIFFLVTIISPFLLFNGITSLGVHEVYVWYMMSPTSLFCAIASFVGILILYILTLPTVYSVCISFCG